MSSNLVATLFKSRHPLIWINSAEEMRVLDALKATAKDLNANLAKWSITKGYTMLEGTIKGGDEKTPIKALEFVMSQAAEVRGIFVLADFHHYIADHIVIRKLREAAQDLTCTKRTIVFIGPVVKIPPELEKEITVIDWSLPDRAEIDRIISGRKIPDGCTLGDVPAVVDACLGLTRPEIDLVLGRSLVEKRTFDVKTILGIKKDIIRKSGILEFYEPTEGMQDVGGLANLKGWLAKRRRAFTPEARSFGLPMPKGAMLIGVPGCGKSLTAKAISASWNLPLLRLDLGKVFGSLVGASEDNLRRAIKAAESVAPCVLWLDEVEKGLSGSASSGQSDGGTTARVFASFLTWMQEKTSSVFVIATANDVRALPPELIRKGRFDEIFFVPLPSDEDRAAILKIQIAKRGQNVSDDEIATLIESTHEFSGAELEQVVIAGMYEAFDSGEPLNADHLRTAIKETTPLAVTMKDQIKSLSEWAKSRARTA